MMAQPDFAGRIADAAAGPIGSKAWVESRAKRMDGEPLPLSTAEMVALRERILERISAAGYRQPPRPYPNYNETALGENGRLEPIADFDDSPAFDPLEQSPRIKFKQDAERVYEQECDDETGVLVNLEKKAKKDHEKSVLKAQSHSIARKLELGKVHAYRSGEWYLWSYGIHSGEWETIPQFRRVAFIPYVAAMIRMPYVCALEAYLERKYWCRFWTLTGGPRVPLKKVRPAIQKLNRRISKLNNAPFMRRAGVRIIFRSDELGTIEKGRKYNDKSDTLDLIDEGGKIAGGIERDEKGELWFHPHAHCVVELEKGRLAKPEWSAFLVTLRAYWGDWMDDSGVIKDVREAVKYVTKPGEIQHLTPDETKTLFQQLSRCKLVQPMGKLREEMKARATAGMRLKRVRTPDGLVWMDVPNHNRRDPGQSDRQKLKNVFTDMEGDPYSENCAASALGVQGPATGKASSLDVAAAIRLGRSSDVDACMVVARCSPAPCSFGLKEPRVIVMGKRRNIERVQKHPLVERLWLRTYDAWHAGLALIRVHTGTPTVLRKPAFAFMPDLAERVEPPGEPVFS